MVTNRNEFLPVWARGSNYKYDFDTYPFWFDDINLKIWERWKAGVYMFGWWEPITPFPQEVLSAWAVWIRTEEARYIEYDNKIQDAFISKLKATFNSKTLRFEEKIVEKSDFTSIDPELQKKHLRLWNNNVLICKKWLTLPELVGGKRKTGSQSGSGPNENILIEPKLPTTNMLYWLAEITSADQIKLCILETPSRQDLGARGNADFFAYGNPIKLHLNSAAVNLGHDWPKLSTVIAMAEHDHRAFRAHREKSQGTDANLMSADISEIEG